MRDFVTAAFACTGIDIRWQGKGLDETGVDVKSGHTLVRVDESYFRPSELKVLIGDAAKARRALGWQPRTSFAELVAEMIGHDRSILKFGGWNDGEFLAA